MNSQANHLNNLDLRWVGSGILVKMAYRSSLVGMRILPRSVYSLFQRLPVEILCWMTGTDCYVYLAIMYSSIIEGLAMTELYVRNQLARST